MNKVYLVSLSLLFIGSLCAQTDLDQDWMDDAWESTYGLNSADESDAYKDSDGDHILNLFEYKLGSDPSNPESPFKINYNPNDDLKSVLLNAPAGSVIRIPSGTHKLEWLKFFREDYSVMLQGGWSSDFSEYNPEAHKTVLDGGDFTVFSFGFLRQSNNVFVVEGVTTQNNKDIFSSYDVSFSDTTTNFLGVHRCLISGMESGLKFSNYDNAKTQISISKSYIVNNVGQGIDVTATDNITVDFKILNNTIANNTFNETGFFSGSALELTTLNNGSMTVDLRNNLIWGNEKGAFELSGFGNPIQFVQYDYNLVQGGLLKSGDVELPNPCCQKNSDPSFIDGTFKLSENSTCIDQGMKIGFDYMGDGVDIGAHEFQTQVSKTQLVQVDHLLKVFPNPVIEKLNFTISSEIRDDIKVEVYSINGKKMLESTYTKNLGLYKIDTDIFAKGTYLLNVSNGTFTASKIFQKI